MTVNDYWNYFDYVRQCRLCQKNLLNSTMEKHLGEYHTDSEIEAYRKADSAKVLASRKEAFIATFQKLGTINEKRAAVDVINDLQRYLRELQDAGYKLDVKITPPPKEENSE